MNSTQHLSNQFHQELLRKNLARIFGELDESLLKTIEPLILWVEIGGGETLFKQNEVGDSLYFVISGRLQALAMDAHNEYKVLGEIIRGETVGEMAIFTGEPRSATIVAIRDSVLVKLSKQVFEQIISEYPAVSMNVTRLIINRLQNSQSLRKPLKKPINICLLPLHSSFSLGDFASELHQLLTAKGTVYLASSEVVNQVHQKDHFAQANKIQTKDYLQLSQWLDEQESKHEYMLYVADSTISEWTRRAVRQADEIILIADATKTPDLTDMESWIQNDHRGMGARYTLILMHPPQTLLPKNTEKWLQLRTHVKAHYHLRTGERHDIARLARIVSGTAVGFVVAGGGAKGFAHIGVMRALEEFKIPIDFVGGTSVGAMVAASISFGKPSKIVQENMKIGAIFNPTKDYNILPFISLIRGNRIRKMIQNTIQAFAKRPDTNLEDTWLPLFVISSNYTQAREEVHRHGSMVKYVQASTAIPGVFPPVIDGNDLLVDGGTFNNFPADVMSKTGVGKVIGVDLTVDKSYPLKVKDIPSPLQLLQDRLRPKKKRKYRLPSVVSILLNSMLLYSAARRNETKRYTDLYFNPDVKRFGIMNWGAFDAIVEKGYEHAKEVLSNLSEEELNTFRD
jgi:NTE family protein